MDKNQDILMEETPPKTCEEQLLREYYAVIKENEKLKKEKQKLEEDLRDSLGEGEPNTVFHQSIKTFRDYVWSNCLISVLPNPSKFNYTLNLQLKDSLDKERANIIIKVLKIMYENKLLGKAPCFENLL